MNKIILNNLKLKIKQKSLLLSIFVSLYFYAYLISPFSSSAIFFEKSSLEIVNTFFKIFSGFVIYIIFYDLFVVDLKSNLNEIIKIQPRRLISFYVLRFITFLFIFIFLFFFPCILIFLIEKLIFDIKGFSFMLLKEIITSLFYAYYINITLFSLLCSLLPLLFSSFIFSLLILYPLWLVGNSFIFVFFIILFTFFIFIFKKVEFGYLNFLKNLLTLKGYFFLLVVLIIGFLILEKTKNDESILYVFLELLLPFAFSIQTFDIFGKYAGFIEVLYCIPFSLLKIYIEKTLKIFLKMFVFLVICLVIFYNFISEPQKIFILFVNTIYFSFLLLFFNSLRMKNSLKLIIFGCYIILFLQVRTQEICEASFLKILNPFSFIFKKGNIGDKFYLLVSSLFLWTTGFLNLLRRKYFELKYEKS